MANPSITAATSITGVTNVVASVVASGTSTVINTVASNHVYKLNSVYAANKTTSDVGITLYVNRSSTAYNLAYQIIVPAKSTVILVGKDAPIYLQESDQLLAVASAATSIDIVASYEDIA